MNALEFTAKVEHGSIQLPKKLREYENRFVRVIMLMDEIDKTSKKEKLLLAIKKMEGKEMFKSIENPTEWQKKIRNEW